MKTRNTVLAALLAAATFSASAQVQSFQLTAAAPTVSENFDSMYDGTSGTKDLPAGWYVYEHMSGPYDFSAVTWTGSVNNLDGNANTAGTYNFLNTEDATDRAVGGQSSDASGRCHGISFMTSVTNGEATDILSSLAISYNVEKYRKNTNAGGFRVQLYTSTDGVNWASAGEDFYTFYEKDAAGGWPTPRPFDIRNVSKSLVAGLAPGQTIYLAWNIAVDSGSTYASAQALGIDDVVITATFTDPAALARNLYVEDLTTFESLVANGNTHSGQKAVNGVTYKIYELAAAPTTVVLGNGVNFNFPAISITEDRDYYYCATRQGLTEIADATAYSGYTDPSIPPFVSSGIYLRGDVNSWNNNLDQWEFSKEGEGNYALYNKTLSGAFKVADAGWTAACNYGTNGGNAYPGVPYLLKSGTDDNCSTGSNTYVAKEIRLTITDSQATLLITTDDDPTGLTKVYAFGDFNNWNYMNESGRLDYDAADGLFHGTITMPKGSNGFSNWLIYQKLGMGGAWGLSEDATAATTEGTLVKGATGHAAVEAGTYDFAFDLTTGAYSLTKQPSVMVDMKINPATPLLVTNVPEKVQVLSLNNSLIDYSDQPDIFNDIALQMGKDAIWTRHTNLGKTLDYHWDEGDGLTPAGNPGAKKMIRDNAWTHIILQEQTNRPVNNTAAFRASVKKWVEYIRENCPNPNAIIILPVNWEYSSNLDGFVSGNANFLEIYRSVAAEEGVILCPVSSAYSVAAQELGDVAMKEHMFLDDRHPVDRSAYMAAVMEYSLIFGVDPLTVTARPEGLTKKSPSAGTITISEEEAAEMRHYASEAFKSFSNYINHCNGTVAFDVTLIDDSDLEYEPETPVTYTVSGGGTIDANGLFTSDGTPGSYTVTVTCGDFTRTATVTVAEAQNNYVEYPALSISEANLSISENFDAMGSTETSLNLPEAWRISRNTSAPRQVGSYADADDAVMYVGGTSLASNAKNGTWNFGANGSDDRALGGITTSVAGGTRGVNLYTHIRHDGKKRLTNATISYDIEKYRDGNNAAGFTVQLYYSYDGKNWTSAGNDFKTDFDPSAATAGASEVPIETVGVSATLPFDLMPSMDFYLAWNISVTSGDACAGAPALAIDNFELEADLPTIPASQHYIYVEDLTGWAALGLYAWGDSEFFGAWPGAAHAGEMDINGVEHKVFLLDTETNGTLNLIFNNWNNGQQTPEYAITPNRDHHFVVTATSVTEKSPSAIEDVNADSELSASDAPAMFFNLQGRRVANPTNGFFIKVQDGKSSKVLVK